MTNIAKFREIFGNTPIYKDQCPIVCYSNLGECPKSKDKTCKGAGDWWNAEYKEGSYESNIQYDL